jgi:hypothetical protein
MVRPTKGCRILEPRTFIHINVRTPEQLRLLQPNRRQLE